MRIVAGAGWSLAVALLVAGCSVRLGGGGPQEYDAAALRGSGDATALGERLRAQGTDVALLAGDQDSAWFAAVAAAARLELSGPGRTGTSGLALLTNLKILGDTALALDVPGGGQLHMQDALYELDRGRHLDLMLVRMDSTAALREAVRTLLAYIATDVGGAASVLLALELPTTTAADSAGLLLRAVFEPAAECGGQGASDAVQGHRLRLFVGPQARIRCERSRLLAGEPPGVLARVVIGR